MSVDIFGVFKSPFERPPSVDIHVWAGFPKFSLYYHDSLFFHGPDLFFEKYYTCVSIRAHHKGVVRAPVTHFRRRHQLQLGGYLRSDGKGFPCAFTIHHSPPRICMVRPPAFVFGGGFFTPRRVLTWFVCGRHVHIHPA